MTVGRRNRRVGRFTKQSARAACRENHLLGPDDCFAVFRVPDDCSHTPTLVSQQVNRESAFPETAALS